VATDEKVGIAETTTRQQRTLDNYTKRSGNSRDNRCGCLEESEHEKELLRLLVKGDRGIEAGQDYDLNTVLAEANAITISFCNRSERILRRLEKFPESGRTTLNFQSYPTGRLSYRRIGFFIK
jgi:hypothetical protein